MFFRSAILYLIVIILMRAMGKRQIGQLQPYELVITILIADLASTPMGDSSVPLLYGLTAIAALVLVQSVLSLISLKSGRLRELINGTASVLVRNGVVDETEMRKQAITLSELLEEIRGAGMTSIDEVGCAVLEVSGKVSLFPTSQKRAVQPCDMGIQTGYEGMPLPLILDGRVLMRSLNKGNLDLDWLRKQMKQAKVPVEQTFLCVLDTQGRMTVQQKGKTSYTIHQALQPKEVHW